MYTVYIICIWKCIWLSTGCVKIYKMKISTLYWTLNKYTRTRLQQLGLAVANINVKINKMGIRTFYL